MKSLPLFFDDELILLRDANEEDVFLQMVDIMEKMYPKIEKTMLGNFQPGVEVRKDMAKVIFLGNVLSEKTLLRRPENTSTEQFLEKAIQHAIDYRKKEEQVEKDRLELLRRAKTDPEIQKQVEEKKENIKKIMEIRKEGGFGRKKA